MPGPLSGRVIAQVLGHHLLQCRLRHPSGELFNNPPGTVPFDRAVPNQAEDVSSPVCSSTGGFRQPPRQPPDEAHCAHLWIIAGGTGAGRTSRTHRVICRLTPTRRPGGIRAHEQKELLRG